MADRTVFRPSLAATVVGVGVLPAFAVALIAVGIGMFMASPDATGLIFGGLFLAVAILPGLLAAVMLRGWFALEVDQEALSLVGLFGFGRLRLPWHELEGVGVARWRGVRVLTVRPLRPWVKSPKWGVLEWDAMRRLLFISGIERWSRPADEILSVVSHHAGSKWQGDWVNDPSLQ